MAQRGRPKKDPQEVKRQLSIFLNAEELDELKFMAQLWGLTISQMVARLVTDAFARQEYIEGYESLSDEEKEDVLARRAQVTFLSKCRKVAADNRNFDRRMGLDRGLTNVMVVEVAPDEVEKFMNLPGVFCHNLGAVWIIPYNLLYRVSLQQIIHCKCYASVLHFFMRKTIDPSKLLDFFVENKDYVLSSEGEKAVLKRLTSFYLHLPKQDFSKSTLTEAEAEAFLEAASLQVEQEQQAIEDQHQKPPYEDNYREVKEETLKELRAFAELEQQHLTKQVKTPAVLNAEREEAKRAQNQQPLDPIRIEDILQPQPLSELPEEDLPPMDVIPPEDVLRPIVDIENEDILRPQFLHELKDDMTILEAMRHQKKAKVGLIKKKGKNKTKGKE